MSERARSSSNPTVSVVVAVHDGAATLERCLASFVRQSYLDKELIVIDGGSTDHSVDIIKASSASIAFWESEPDRGIYHAWNKALAQASGDWICFIGSDDYFWSDEVLEKIAPHLKAAYPESSIVYGRIAVVSPNGAVLRHEGQDWPTSASTFTRAMNLPHPGLMHHRSVFEDHGLFDENLRVCADYDLLLRELPARPACFAPDVITLGVQRGGVSYAPSMMSAMLKELQYIRRKHGLRSPALWHTPPVLWKMRVSALLNSMLGGKGAESAAALYRRLVGVKT